MNYIDSHVWTKEINLKNVLQNNLQDKLFIFEHVTKEKYYLKKLRERLKNDNINNFSSIWKFL